jgi:hypothetical protein
MKYALLALVAAGSLFGDPIVTATYENEYSIVDLGPAANVPLNYGGLTFLAGDPNTLLIAGHANNGAGVINALSVIRNGDGHITGFAPSATFFANAPDNDGGLAYAPNGTLFFTRYNDNQVGEIKPGSTNPDLIVGLSSSLSSVGTLNFVPGGYNTAGDLILGSYSNATFCTAPTFDNGDGTYDIGACSNSVDIGSGGPEGIIYVPQGSADFSNPSVLISLYSSGIIASYQTDANGLPIVATRQNFITGLSNVEGAVVDPLTGDFLFSTYGSSSHIYQVTGFATPTPEPGTILLLTAGLAGAAVIRRRKA